MLTLLTDTIAGFSNDHEDVHPPIDAFSNVSQDLVLRAIDFSQLDDSPSSDDASPPANEESPIPTGQVQENIYHLFIPHELSCLNTMTEAPPYISIGTYI